MKEEINYNLTDSKKVAVLVILITLTPLIFVHVWWLRLGCVLLLATYILWELVIQLLNPEWMFSDETLININLRRVSTFIMRLTFILILPVVMYFGVFLTSRDILIAIISGNIEREIITMKDVQARRFWFIGQSFEMSGRRLILPLYPKPLKNEGLYTVTYMPGSKFVYDVAFVSDDKNHFE